MTESDLNRPPAPPAAGPARKRALRKGQHDDLLGLPMVLAGLALFVGPYIGVSEPDMAKDANVNEYVVGTIVLFTAGARVWRGGGLRSDLVILAAGLWMLVSPFLLTAGDTHVTEPRVLDVTVGIVLTLTAIVSLLLLRAARGGGTGGEAYHRRSAPDGPGVTQRRPNVRRSHQATSRG
jgi:hypothetical protein